MISCGIVAEYNPFHNGHKYQIEQIRQHLNPDVVIAVMSGNFLQRGEPAIVDKWTRTKMALAGGVDLVVELPAIFAVQPADFFAKGAVQVLNTLNIDYISFGVEQGSAEDFLTGAEWMVSNEQRIDEAIRTSTDTHLPYAKQMEDIIKELAPTFPLHLNSPNNQLGFAYAKEIIRNYPANKVELFPIQRKSAAYNDRDLNQKSQIASATAIRLGMLAGKEVSQYIPKGSYNYLSEVFSQIVSWDDYYLYLKYQITVQNENRLRGIYQMNEGLENRLKDYIIQSTDFSDFMTKIKTKRYTQTRLQRLLTYVLLQWENEKVLSKLQEEPPIRILGFSSKGQEYLSELKHDLKMPFISNVNKKTSQNIPVDLSAGEIYRLAAPFIISRQDFGQKPIKID